MGTGDAQRTGGGAGTPGASQRSSLDGKSSASASSSSSSSPVSNALSGLRGALLVAPSTIASSLARRSYTGPAPASDVPAQPREQGLVSGASGDSQATVSSEGAARRQGQASGPPGSPGGAGGVASEAAQRMGGGAVEAHKGAAPGGGNATPNKKQRGGSPLLKSLSRGFLPSSGQQQQQQQQQEEGEQGQQQKQQQQEQQQQQRSSAEPSLSAPEATGSTQGPSPGCAMALAADAGLRIEGQLVEGYLEGERASYLEGDLEGYLEGERASADPGSEGPAPQIPAAGADPATSGCARDHPGVERLAGEGNHPSTSGDGPREAGGAGKGGGGEGRRGGAFGYALNLPGHAASASASGVLSVELSPEAQRERMVQLLRAFMLAKHVKTDNQPCKVMEGLFVGSVGAAYNKAALLENRIRAVVVVANSLQPLFPDDFSYTLVDVLDSPDVDLVPRFEECFQAIDKARDAGGGALVHCFAGRSRSVTVVVAYVMARRCMGRDAALELVRQVRPEACPNVGFMHQLGVWEEQLRNQGLLGARDPMSPGAHPGEVPTCTAPAADSGSEQDALATGVPVAHGNSDAAEGLESPAGNAAPA